MFLFLSVVLLHHEVSGGFFLSPGKQRGLPHSPKVGVCRCYYLCCLTLMALPNQISSSSSISKLSNALEVLLENQPRFSLTRESQGVGCGKA